jgi:hypothetical protein
LLPITGIPIFLLWQGYDLSRTDDALLELAREVAVYLSDIPAFRYENTMYRLIDNYAAVPQMRCDVCGEYPLFEVSVIESEDGSTRLHVGDSCIDSMTGQRISDWFKSFRRKRSCIMANRKYVDQLPLILDAYDEKKPRSMLTPRDAEKLRGILEQVCKGYDLSTNQVQVADYFLGMDVTS